MNNDHSTLKIISSKLQTLQLPDNESNRPTVPENPYFKDGKLSFQETKLRAENHPLIASKILTFRHYRAQLENTPDAHSVDIPVGFLDIIAALVQDSDEHCTVLTSRINDCLSPFQRKEEMAHKYDLAIERAIKQVAQKNTYGLSIDAYNSMEHHTPNIPWHLCIHRWEVQNLSLLPTDLQQAVMTRRQAREQMTFSFSTFILQLPTEVRKSTMTTKHRRTNVVKEILVEDLRQKHTASSPKQQMESEQEMEEKRKKKEEEKRKKEEEKKQREEEKKQREEEKRQREEEKKQREEEKRQREEEKKRQKEEERRQKEEEKKKREEEKRKKEQSQLRLTSLFSKTSESVQEKTLEPVRPTLFPAFYIKDHVEIVDIHQFSQPASSIDEFKRQLQAQQRPVSIQQFISDLPAESKQKRGATTPVDIRTLLLPGSADLLNVPNVRLVLRMKLLQFMENVRPAYFGTFTQRSRTVHGRNPFGRDTDVFNYEHDSEAEWEPEGEGEDIHSDEDDDDPNVDMIDPEDAGWLVPEGYLSDSEGVDDEDKDSKDDRMHSIKHASKRVAIRKVVLGPYFEGETEEMEVFKQFETQFFTDLSEGGYDPFLTKHLQNAATSTSDASNTAAHTATTVQHKLEFTEEQSQALINVIHEKSKESIPNLVIEAKSNSFLKDVSKRQLEAKIKDIAIKEKRGADTKPTWYLKDDRKQTQP